jgi:hypothetical protein
MRHTRSMSTARDDGRPDRRPEWLRRKHGHAGPKPRTKLDLWADKVVQILDGLQSGQHTTPWPDQARADEARKALNRAARRAGVSVGAYLADPDTGTCVNCDRMRCQPSAKGQLVLHVNTFTKKDAYAYMLDRYGPDTSTWPYIPGGRPPARPGNPAASPGSAAAKVPAACPHCHRRWRGPHWWQRFTCPACNGTVERHPAAESATQPRIRRGGDAAQPPDKPPAGPEMWGGTPRAAVRPQQKAGTDADAKTGRDADQSGREPLLTRLRRSLG